MNQFFTRLLERFLGIFAQVLPNASNTYITQSGDAGYFDINYTKQAEANLNTNFAILAMMQKVFDEKGDIHDGLRSEHDVELTYSGGTTWSAPGTTRSANVQKAQLDHKDIFSTAYADAKTVSLTRRDKKVSHGSILDWEIKSKILNTKRQVEIAIFGQGDGRLGVGDGSTPTGTAAAPVIIISQTSWCPYRFEVKDIVNMGSATDNYEVTAVNESTRAVTLSRLDGSVDLTSGAFSSVVYLQNSKDAAWHGLREVCDATSGTLYGLTVGRRWQSEQYAATGAVTLSMLRQRAIKIRNRTGTFPNLITASSAQFDAIMTYADSLQKCEVNAKPPMKFDDEGNLYEYDDRKYYAHLGFEAVGLAVPGAVIPIVDSRFIEDDRIYLVNTEKMRLKLTSDAFHWLKQGSDVWLRVAGSKFYEAIYCAFGNIYINPLYQGVITGLPY